MDNDLKRWAVIMTSPASTPEERKEAARRLGSAGGKISKGGGRPKGSKNKPK